MKDQCYEFLKGPNKKASIVGFGSYGEVKLARNCETGQVVAIKMIVGRSAKEEIDVHHKLNHPNIIKMLNYCYEKHRNTTYLVLEYAEKGTLHERIKFGYGHLPKEKVRRYFKDICQAVRYLHSLKYMHRDIKPENILITKQDRAKLCDFGFAAMLSYRNTLCGTHEYMAPQMIKQKPYDYRIDIWALGVLLFQLINGHAPFRGETGKDVIAEMRKQIVFSNRFQKQEISLIKKILRVNPENRPNVQEILSHEFFWQGQPKESQTQTLTRASNESLEKFSSSEQKQLTSVLMPKPPNRTGQITSPSVFTGQLRGANVKQVSDFRTISNISGSSLFYTTQKLSRALQMKQETQKILKPKSNTSLSPSSCEQQQPIPATGKGEYGIQRDVNTLRKVSSGVETSLMSPSRNKNLAYEEMPTMSSSNAAITVNNSPYHFKSGNVNISYLTPPSKTYKKQNRTDNSQSQQSQQSSLPASPSSPSQPYSPFSPSFIGMPANPNLQAGTFSNFSAFGNMSAWKKY